MTEFSNFRQAIGDAIVICKKCGAADIPKAKPTIEKEQNGSLTCTACASNWDPNAKER